jgi:hypothetical protein
MDFVFVWSGWGDLDLGVDWGAWWSLDSRLDVVFSCRWDEWPQHQIYLVSMWPNEQFDVVRLRGFPGPARYQIEIDLYHGPTCVLDPEKSPSVEAHLPQ